MSYAIFKTVHALTCCYSQRIETLHARELGNVQYSPASTSSTTLAKSLFTVAAATATAATKSDAALVIGSTAARTSIAGTATAASLTHGDPCPESIISNGSSKTLDREDKSCASTVVSSSLESDGSDADSRVQTVDPAGVLLQAWLRDTDSPAPPLRLSSVAHPHNEHRIMTAANDDVVGRALLRMGAIIRRVLAPVEGHLPGSGEAASDVV